MERKIGIDLDKVTLTPSIPQSHSSPVFFWGAKICQAVHSKHLDVDGNHGDLSSWRHATLEEGDDAGFADTAVADDTDFEGGGYIVVDFIFHIEGHNAKMIM